MRTAREDQADLGIALPRIEYLRESRPEPVGCQFRHAGSLTALLEVTPAAVNRRYFSSTTHRGVQARGSVTRVQVFRHNAGQPARRGEMQRGRCRCPPSRPASEQHRRGE